ncbi:hypothetical protein AAE478_001194 [Parahypoxylon ruwenzoriense]
MEGKQSITIEDARGALAVVFSEATTAQERVQCQKLASTAFGRSLSKAGYLEREAFLGSLPLVQNGGWRYWSLTRADDPNHVLAMCKTMHRDLLVRDASGTRQEQGYCICSVITDSSHRGRGLASVLLRKVAEWMDGPGDATASMLYSDIGKFYASKGWDVMDAFQSSLTAPPSILPEQPRFAETRFLTRDDIPGLCERDVEGLKSEFDGYEPGESARMTVLPTANLIGWLHGRAEFMATKALGKAPDIKGSICESAGSWLYWYHHFSDDELAIQRVKLRRSSHSDAAENRVLAQLLLDAVEEARKWKLPRVVVWDPSPEVQKALKFLSQELRMEVTSEERQNIEIPCIRYRNGEKRSVVVKPNEFYGWS